jgi:hypothetical protein
MLGNRGIIADGQELCSNQKTFISLVVLLALILIYFLLPVKLLENYVYLAKVFAAIIGFYFAIIVGHCLIKMTSDTMWLAVTGYSEDPESHFDTSAIIGWLERALYILFLLLHKPEAIGLWLTLKQPGVFGQKKASKIAPSRVKFTKFS